MNVPGADVAFLHGLQDDSFAEASEATRTSYPPEHRMNAAAVAEYLAQRRYLVVATVRKDGRPHAALSAFAFACRRFWLPTMAGTIRGRNVRAGRYVSLVVAEGEGSDHKAVLSEGPAQLVADLDEGVVEAWCERHGSLPEWADAWIRVEPSKLFSYDARALERELMGWTCEACGDTFTTHSGQAPLCPSCGKDSVRIAAEPFL